MKKWLLTLVLISALFLFYPSCKTTEAFVWNPVGNWIFQFSAPGSYGNWTENLNLTGSESGGAVNGWQKYNPAGTPGTWTKTGNFTISMTVDFINIIVHDVVEVTGSSSEANPNFMTGSGTWTATFITTSVDTLTYTATKTTNLQ